MSLDNYKEKLREADQRADTMFGDILLKVPISEGDDVGKLTDELRTFAAKIHVVGRTEVFPAQIGVSIVDPEKYRYELLDKIAQDLRTVKNIFGEDYRIAISGLDQRISWERTNVSEVELYIDYKFMLLPLVIEDYIGY